MTILTDEKGNCQPVKVIFFSIVIYIMYVQEVLTHYMKWVKTSWTYAHISPRLKV